MVELTLRQKIILTIVIIASVITSLYFLMPVADKSFIAQQQIFAAERRSNANYHWDREQRLWNIVRILLGNETKRDLNHTDGWATRIHTLVGLK